MRDAASGWKEAGAIEARDAAAIENEYPAGCRVLAPVWRVLIFLLLSMAVHGLFGGVFTLGSQGILGPACMVYGALLAAAPRHCARPACTVPERRPPRRSGRVLYLSVGVAVFLMQDLRLADGPALTLSSPRRCRVRRRLRPLGIRGPRCFGGRRALPFPGALPGGTASVDCRRRARRAWPRPDGSTGGAYAPPHRRAFEGVLAVGAIALYAAVNLFSVDRGLVESLRESAGAAPSPAGGRAVRLGRGDRPRARRRLRLGARVAPPDAAPARRSLRGPVARDARYYAHLEPLWLVLAGDRRRADSRRPWR